MCLTAFDCVSATSRAKKSRRQTTSCRLAPHTRMEQLLPAPRSDPFSVTHSTHTVVPLQRQPVVHVLRTPFLLAEFDHTIFTMAAELTPKKPVPPEPAPVLEPKAVVEHASEGAQGSPPPASRGTSHSRNRDTPKHANTPRVCLLAGSKKKRRRGKKKKKGVCI